MASDTSYVPVHQAMQSQEISTPGRSSSRAGRWTAWTEDGWFWEIASTVLGIVLVIALISVLRAYDGKPAPQFGLFLGSALTLNTVAAILSTAAKAALLYPVAECISQWKWIWFSKEYRQLSDMSVFDKASRGLHGGFELVWKTRLRTFAALGSFLFLFGIAIDPLSQQLISYNSLSVATSDNVTIPTSADYEDIYRQSGMMIGNNGDPDAASISIGMKGQIQAGLYAENETIANIEPLCHSGNCTFNTYQSLAVCSSFADVSSHLRLEGNTSADFQFSTSRWALSSNSYVRPDFGYFNMSSAAPSDEGPLRGNSKALNFSNSIMFKDKLLPLADVFVIYAKQNEGRINYPNGTSIIQMKFGAIEFILEWCVQEFSTTVVNTVANTTRGEAIRNATNPPYPTLQVGPKMRYKVDPDTHSSASRFLNRILRGAVTQDPSMYWSASSDVAQALYDPFNIWQMHAKDTVWAMSNGIRGTNQTGLELIINNVATGMTNFIRRQGEKSAGGVMFVQEIIVHVRWGWIAAHASFIVLCLLLLASTIMLQHIGALRGYTWKSSNSAVLHALSSDLQRDLKGLSTESRLSSLDREVLVRLCNLNDDGWRLLAHDKQHDFM